MHFPALFFAVMILFILFWYNLKKGDKKEQNKREQFWDQEEKSLFVRKKEIQESDLIHPNPEALPRHEAAYYRALGREYLWDTQERCISCTEHPMMNLVNVLNSEIRLRYGTANLTVIENYEDNYNQYVKSLHQMAKGLYGAGQFKDATLYLEEAEKVKTEIGDSYILLGTLYLDQGNIEAFNRIYDTVSNLSTLTKSRTLKALDEAKNKKEVH